jgi:hypothetical protein
MLCHDVPLATGIPHLLMCANVPAKSGRSAGSLPISCSTPTPTVCSARWVVRRCVCPCHLGCTQAGHSIGGDAQAAKDACTCWATRSQRGDAMPTSPTRKSTTRSSSCRPAPCGPAQGLRAVRNPSRSVCSRESSCTTPERTVAWYCCRPPPSPGNEACEGTGLRSRQHAQARESAAATVAVAVDAEVLGRPTGEEVE